MTLTPDVWWPSVLLAVVVFADAVMSLRPPRFIRDCLDGVRFPREWWWILIVIKLLAVAGLIAGIWLPGVGFAANVGVVAYFICAAVAHIRARFTGQTFWINCLGMLALSVVVLVLSYAL
ncbi:DoxX family protein [Microbacterium sp. P04]|uniref:DoxX family protein n=1 Tax=Microbacterium sp. P04 TaxID=3366947 RepID=UPI003744EE3B